MTETAHWRYEVVADGRRGYRARQYMDDQLLKSAWAETEWDAQAMCKAWENARGRAFEL